MIENLKALGVLFDWPKRSRWFENVGADINQNRPLDQKIKKEKIKPLCETRWIERHTSIENFSQLYEPICITLKDIAANHQSWDAKSMTESSVHLNTITSPGFIVAFMVNKYIMGFTKSLSIVFQGSMQDILVAYEEVNLVKEQLESVREDEEDTFDQIYNDCMGMAQIGRPNTSCYP